jgi:HAD superfamily hydrolase (TIGR01509 family)
MIRTILSDLGQVILFFDNNIFFRRMAAFCDHSAEKIRELAHVNFHLVELFDSGKVSPREFYVKTTEKLGARISEEEFFAQYCDVFWLNLPVLDVFTRRKGKYRLVLVSNTDVRRFSFVKQRFPEVLVFDQYVLSYELGFMKPHPEIYRRALEAAQASAGESVFIDDLQENIEGAARVGIQGILYEPVTDLEGRLNGLR